MGGSCDTTELYFWVASFDLASPSNQQHDVEHLIGVLTTDDWIVAMLDMLSESLPALVIACDYSHHFLLTASERAFLVWRGAIIGIERYKLGRPKKVLLCIASSLSLQPYLREREIPCYITVRSSRAWMETVWRFCFVGRNGLRYLMGRARVHGLCLWEGICMDVCIYVNNGIVDTAFLGVNNTCVIWELCFFALIFPYLAWM